MKGTDAVEIVQTDEVVNLDMKRCYLPFEVTATCPECKARITRYLSDDYVGYPPVNKPFDLDMYHDEVIDDEDVHHEWSVQVILRMTLGPA